MFNFNGEESVYELYIYYIYTYIYICMRRKGCIPSTRVKSAFCSVLFQLVLTQYVTLTGEI